MMPGILRALFLPLLAACAIGCGPKVDVTLLGNPRTPHEGRGVRILFKGESLPKTYDRIALLRVVGEQYSTQDEVLNELKRKAWGMGADAVMDVEVGTERREEGIEGLNSGSNRREYTAITFSGVAIVALDPDFALDYDLRFLGKGPKAEGGEGSAGDQVGAVITMIFLTLPVLWVIYFFGSPKAD